MRGALFGLTITNPGAARTAKLSVDAHSELMGQYPWGFTGVTPNASDNLPDTGNFNGQDLVFTDDGALPGAPVHHYAALVGTSMKPDTGAIGSQFYGPQPGHRCTGTEPGAPADPKPSACDDGPFGKGTGGELTYTLALPGRRFEDRVVGRRRFRPGRCQPGPGPGPAGVEQGPARTRPAALAAKVASREQLAQQDAALAARRPDGAERGRLGQAEHGRPHAERAEPAGPLDQPGQAVPGAARHRAQKRPGSVPAIPDYPWIFGTDGEYTAFAAVAVGQFAAIEDHLRTLRDISDILNNRSGVVVHESVADGSIWFGHDSRQTTNGTTTYDFNTDETVKFPSAVALVWRWTGDNAFRDQMYDFTVRNLQLRRQQAGRRPRRLAGGLGQRGAHRDGSGEAGQRGLSDPRPVRPGRHGALQARRGDLRVGEEPRPQAAAALRQHLVVPGRVAVRRLPAWTPATSSCSSSTGSARRPWRPSSTSTARQSPAWRRSTMATPRSRVGRTTASAGPRRSTLGCSTPGAPARRPARARRSSTA